MSEQYKVQLDSYNGPLDLLLYLIKQQEVDIYDIPIATVTAQYLHYVELVRQVDPDHIGEFLVLAATLMEIKSRTLLPRPPAAEDEDELVDPRIELVRQLLEYKRFKDAASRIGEAADIHARRFGRLPAGLPKPEAPEVDLENVQIWDLLKAFDTVLQQVGLAGHAHAVVYDDTPIALHADDLMDQVGRAGGSMIFTSVFEDRPKGEIIGLFLALLELIRARRLRVDQQDESLVLHLVSAEPLLTEDIDPALRGEPSTEPEPPLAAEPPEAQDPASSETGEPS